jgi:hypothetical protein
MIVKELASILIIAGFLGVVLYGYFGPDDYPHDNIYEEHAEALLEQKIERLTGIPMEGKIDFTPSSPEKPVYKNPKHDYVCPENR